MILHWRCWFIFIIKKFTEIIIWYFSLFVFVDSSKSLFIDIIFFVTDRLTINTTCVQVWASLIAIAGDYTRNLHVISSAILSPNRLRIQQVSLYTFLYYRIRCLVTLPVKVDSVRWSFKNMEGMEIRLVKSMVKESSKNY